MTIELPWIQLALAMSSVSHRIYGVEWESGIEYILYKAVLDGPMRVNGILIDYAVITHLDLLSRRANVWVYSDANEKLHPMPLIEWHQNFIKEFGE